MENFGKIDHNTCYTILFGLVLFVYPLFRIQT